MAPVTFDFGDVAAFMDEWDSEVDHIGRGCAASVKDALRRGKAEGRARAPARSYELRDSIDSHVAVENAAGASGEVRADAPHGVFVSEGTKPHTIQPRTKKALRWTDGAGAHFSKKVRHPGTKANRFWDDTQDSVNAELQRGVDQTVDKAIRG